MVWHTCGVPCPRRTDLTAIVLCVVLAPLAGVTGCGAEGGGDAGGDDSAMPVDGPIPQGDTNALLNWLDGGGYADWPAESAVHVGGGPHFGDVRTFLNEALIESLEAGADEHPAGSATVKELYGSGASVLGWSVSIKLDDDSAGGDNWFWYEYYEGNVLADGDGIAVCTGCHGGGTDYVLSPFPLQ